MALGDAEVKRFQFDLQGKKEELSTTLQRFRQVWGVWGVVVLLRGLEGGLFVGTFLTPAPPSHARTSIHTPQITTQTKHTHTQAKGQRLEGPRAAVIELEAKLRANETGRKQKQEVRGGAVWGDFVLRACVWT